MSKDAYVIIRDSQIVGPDFDTYWEAKKAAFSLYKDDQFCIGIRKPYGIFHSDIAEQNDQHS
jgi:hypothetical protein